LETNYRSNGSSFKLAGIIRNQWGFSRDGKPVYPEFSDTLHVAGADLAPIPSVPIVVGADAGLTPAAVFVQHTPQGQLRVLDGLTWDGGAIAFSGAINRLIGTRGYDRHELIGACDPAAGAQATTDERTWLQVVAAHTKISWRKAPTNGLSARLEAVRLPLARLIDGDPGLLLSPRCKVLRKGFNAGYRLKRIRVAGSELRWTPTFGQQWGESKRESHPRHERRLPADRVWHCGAVAPFLQ